MARDAILQQASDRLAEQVREARLSVAAHLMRMQQEYVEKLADINQKLMRLNDDTCIFRIASSQLTSSDALVVRPADGEEMSFPVPGKGR